MYTKTTIIALILSSAVIANDVDWTDPPDGKTLAFEQLDSNDHPHGPRSITIKLTGTSTTFDLADVEVVSDQTAGALEISEDSMTGSGSLYVLHFTRNMVPGEELEIKIDEDDDGTTDLSVFVKFYPGDFNGDGKTNSADEDELDDAIAAGSKTAMYDINLDNTVDSGDATAFDKIQADFGETVTWSTFVHSSSACCCNGTICDTLVEASCGGTSVSCPCTGSSCSP